MYEGVGAAAIREIRLLGHRTVARWCINDIVFSLTSASLPVYNAVVTNIPSYWAIAGAVYFQDSLRQVPYLGGNVGKAEDVQAHITWDVG
eukprot:scaffold443288_cov19-Prasinocladus_malaysianus.AAC.1